MSACVDACNWYRMCACPPDSKIKYSVFYVYLCSCIIILCVILLLSFMQSSGKFLCYSKTLKIMYSVFCIDKQEYSGVPRDRSNFSELLTFTGPDG